MDPQRRDSAVIPRNPMWVKADKAYAMILEMRAQKWRESKVASVVREPRTRQERNALRVERLKGTP